MRFGSLFAGIGGFDLGLERAGMECAWQVEIDDYAQKVLAKHWPEVPRWSDVRTFPPPEGDWGVDVICGGFPCQDISLAGKGAGLAGTRSGLWYEFARIVGELRPRYVVVENVAALLVRGMDAVLGTLSSLGYDAEWHVIPASAVGAPHRRERVWIVALNTHRIDDGTKREIRPQDSHPVGVCSSVSYAHGGCLHRIDADAGNGGTVSCEGPVRLIRRSDGRSYVADAGCLNGHGRQSQQEPADRQEAERSKAVDIVERRGSLVADADGAGREQQRRPESARTQQPSAECGAWWQSEPNVGRVAHGVPSRVDRLRCLGNAVVPQVVELIGRAIMEHDRRIAGGWEEVPDAAAAGE